MEGEQQAEAGSRLGLAEATGCLGNDASHYTLRLLCWSLPSSSPSLFLQGLPGAQGKVLRGKPVVSQKWLASVAEQSRPNLSHLG